MREKNTVSSAVSDEEIIAALLANGTIRAAAEACGLQPRTMYDRMKSREFNAAYTAAKTDIIRTAVLDANRALSRAIETIRSIMDNESNNPAIRMQAAQTIINTAGKFADRLNQQEKELREESKNPLSLDDMLLGL